MSTEKRAVPLEIKFISPEEADELGLPRESLLEVAMLRVRLRHEEAGDLVISNEFGPQSQPSRSKGAKKAGLVSDETQRTPDERTKRLGESLQEKWDSLRPMDRKQWIGQTRGEPLPIFFSKWDELTAQEQSLIEKFLLRKSARRLRSKDAATDGAA